MEYASEASEQQIVIEICSASERTSKVCAHSPTASPLEALFHRIVSPPRVEDDADVDVIRKRYDKLALQVHPDKNDHPDAEIAFKLLLEAYKCLSDPAKRSAFDVEKRKNACPECLNLPLCRPSRENKVPDFDTLKNVQDRFREKTRVIKNFMRSYAENLTTKTRQQCIRPKTVWETSMNLLSIFDHSLYGFSG